MNDVQAEKQDFTHKELRAMVAAATDDEVRTVIYAVEGSEELVRIVYRNGYEKRVCVTGDSKVALARDVLKAV